jgi:hypothetical protein
MRPIPWTASVGTGYSSGQAGYFLNAIKTAVGQVDVRRVEFGPVRGSIRMRIRAWTRRPRFGRPSGIDHVAIRHVRRDRQRACRAGPAADRRPTRGPRTSRRGELRDGPGRDTSSMRSSNIIDRFNFDTSSNVLSSVNAYAAGQDPAAKVWDALRADHATADTFGQMAGAPIVAGYASGQSPAASVLGALLSSYTSPGTAGAKLNAIGGDPWAAAVGAGYLSTQAGAHPQPDRFARRRAHFWSPSIAHGF